MHPLYYPNSLTFIANLTGADSVSHRIIGQTHSDKQLQENNPTCKKTTPLLLAVTQTLSLKPAVGNDISLNSSIGRCGSTVMGTSPSRLGSLVCSAAASHGLLAVSKIPQQFPLFLFEQTKPDVTVLQVTL